jgi:5-methylcytosine-specific restriction endonuclease McrA
MPKIGFKHSEETKKRMSESRRGVGNAMWGRKHSNETKEKIGEMNRNPSKETRRRIGLCHIGKQPFLGKKHSKNTKIAIGDALRGKKRLPFTNITRDKMRIASMGRRHSLETRRKLSELHTGIPNFKIRGENHPQWRGGITSVNHKIRTSGKYRRWRVKILERDGYKCQLCPKIGGELHVDHIKSFTFYPELRFEVDNGRTLCAKCHRNTETYGKKINFEIKN